MSKLLLFTSTTCPRCPVAKRLVKTHNLDCDLIEVGVTPGAEVKAIAAGVRSIPQFVIKTGASYELIDFKDETEFDKIKAKFQKEEEDA